MFSIELDLISVVANPKVDNQALSIRIWGRYICIIFLASSETRFISKMQCFQSNQNPGSIHFSFFLTTDETRFSAKVMCFQT